MPNSGTQCPCPKLVENVYDTLLEYVGIYHYRKPTQEQSSSKEKVKAWLDSRLVQLTKDKKTRIKNLGTHYRNNPGGMNMPFGLARSAFSEAYKRLKREARREYTKARKGLEDAE